MNKKQNEILDLLKNLENVFKNEKWEEKDFKVMETSLIDIDILLNYVELEIFELLCLLEIRKVIVPLINSYKDFGFEFFL
jgi:hypothetical protein